MVVGRSGGPMLQQSGAYPRAFGEFVVQQFQVDGKLESLYGVYIYIYIWKSLAK